MLRLPIHVCTRFVLVGPHYPENLGASARALKTMGFYKLGLVNPSRLAVPEHEMAQKMAVKAWDVLDDAKRYESLSEALVGADFVVATSSRRGISRVWSAREAAARLVKRAANQERLVIMIGNEKTGLSRQEVNSADACVRIPIAAPQPSVNLAQAVQVIAYELFATALEARELSHDA